MTHVTQALDCGLFSPYKVYIGRLSHQWHADPVNAGEKLDQYSFMTIVAFQAFEKTFSNPENIKNAFKRTGIFPWNKIKPDLRKLKAGTIYKKNFVHEEVFPFPPGSDLVSEPVSVPIVSDPDNAPVDYWEDPVDPLEGMVAAVAVDTTVAVAPAPPSATCSAASSNDVALPSASTSSLPSSDPIVRETSSSSTATLPTGSTLTVERLLEEQSQLTHQQKQKKLEKFELLISDEHKELFEELFAKRMLDIPHAEYQAWLVLKQQAVGTVEEAIDRVLSSRIPKNVAKKKSTRTNDLPKGDARYDPLHKEYYEYFERVEKRKEGKRKVSSTSTSDSLPPLLSNPGPAPKRKRKTRPKS